MCVLNSLQYVKHIFFSRLLDVIEDGRRATGTHTEFQKSLEGNLLGCSQGVAKRSCIVVTIARRLKYTVV